MAGSVNERRGVMIADDHVLVRAGVRTLLESSRRYRLVDEAIDVAGCLSRIGSLRPAVTMPTRRRCAVWCVTTRCVWAIWWSPRSTPTGWNAH